jgi:hypothetical protein
VLTSKFDGKSTLTKMLGKYPYFDNKKTKITLFLWQIKASHKNNDRKCNLLIDEDLNIAIAISGRPGISHQVKSKRNEVNYNIYAYELWQANRSLNFYF